MLRYIQTDETGFITAYCADPVVIDGVTITIDTEGMTIPEKPTDAVYALYYNETDSLHWVKVADFEETTPQTSQLDRMEEMLKKSHEEIKNEAIDEYTAMLMEEGVL